MVEKLPKLLRIVRSNTRTYPKVYIGEIELLYVRYHSDCDRGGSTVTLTFPADHVEWDVEDDATQDR